MNNWQQLIIKPDDSLREVIKTLNVSQGQIVLVCNERHRLVGTITDGDLRRGLLSGHDIKSKAKSIMHKHFIFCGASTDAEMARELMQDHEIYQIPILDAKKNVLGLYLLEEIELPKQMPNTVVIMAGGIGSRLKPLTNTCPKPMLKIAGKPILQIILENLKSQGFKQFLISVNYLSETIIDYFSNGSNLGVNIEYIHETKKMGTAGALGYLKKEYPEPIIVMNGDVLTQVNFSRLLDYHHDTNSQATVCLRNYETEVPYGVVKLDGVRIKEIVEKPISRHFVSAGIYVLDNDVLSHFKEGEFKDMPDLFKELIAENKPVSGFPVHEYWLDIGQHNQFSQASSDFETTFNYD